jgi:hypothetical protein
VYPVNSSPYNIPYNEWTARWWRWVFSIPIDKNPLVDKVGGDCAESQRGPVWFLAGTTGETHSAIRRCSIPSGKSILFPIIVSLFSFAEVRSIKTDEELISCTAKDMDEYSLLEASIDGQRLKNLDQYRVRFGPFDINIVSNNIWNVHPGFTRAVSDGFWIFLEPMNVGYHKINFHGREPNFYTDVTYYIMIV